MTECDAKQVIDIVFPSIFLISSYVFIWSTVRLFR
jgi:hypothetical protein